MKKLKDIDRFWYNWAYLLLIIVCIFSNVFYVQLGKVLYLYPDYEFSGKTEIHFIDVGEGDCIAIKFDNDEVMLIDSGIESYYKKLVSYLDNIVLQGRNKIDYLVLTHIDADHSGNLNAIINRYDVEVFYRPPVKATCEGGSYDETNIVFDKIISNSISKNITMVNNESGLSLQVSNCKLEWLSPINVEDKADVSSNNYSAVIKLIDQEKTALFTGDIDINVENELLNIYGNNIDVDILKVAHHGSSSSTSQQFLDTITPDYAFISVGENSYGHPSTDVYERIARYDDKFNKNLLSNTFITKTIGNIFVVLDNDILINNIKNIDAYAFVDYYIYSIIAIIFLLICMGIPYYRPFIKEMRFYFQNKRFERQNRQ